MALIGMIIGIIVLFSSDTLAGTLLFVVFALIAVLSRCFFKASHIKASKFAIKNVNHFVQWKLNQEWQESHGVWWIITTEQQMSSFGYFKRIQVWYDIHVRVMVTEETIILEEDKKEEVSETSEYVSEFDALVSRQYGADFCPFIQV